MERKRIWRVGERAVRESERSKAPASEAARAGMGIAGGVGGGWERERSNSSRVEKRKRG